MFSKNLFTVPETVRQAEAAITEGKLLEAHKVKKEIMPFPRIESTPKFYYFFR
jgi:hypothetical protein